MEGGTGFVRSARSPFQSYAEREVLDRAFLPIFRLADYLVGGVSGLRGDEVRCHELARAVVSLLARRGTVGVDLIVVDGMLGPVEHSWIELSSARGVAILDTYAPGRVPQVQLIASDLAISSSYVRGAARLDIDAALVESLAEEMLRRGTGPVACAYCSA